VGGVPILAWEPMTPQIEHLPLATLKAYGRNSRTHSETQVAQLAASIREFGFNNPVLVRGDGTIVAGHGRVAAARQLGLAEVPCMRLDHLTEEQARAYVIADNQLATNAGWDADLLRLELEDLQGAGFDLSVLGFSGDELAVHMAAFTEGKTDPDAAPPVPETPLSVLGDVWLLGRHRLVCGDCTQQAAVAAALGEHRPHLMVTDPPYGVNYDPEWRGVAGVSSAGSARGKVLNDDRADWREAWALFPGDVVYVWHSGLFSSVVSESLRACKFGMRAHIVWVKQRHVLSRGHYHHQHEPAYYGVRDGAEEHWSFVPEHEIASYAVKKGEAASWRGGRKQSTVWFIEHLKSDTGHGTQKPIDCMKRPIENNSLPGDAVYEPFSGSGTTLIAAEMTGRRCLALELSPAYVDVAVRRWQNFTGQSATRERDGLPFGE
jgi:DNA modification methylase